MLLTFLLSHTIMEPSIFDQAKKNPNSTLSGSGLQINILKEKPSSKTQTQEKNGKTQAKNGKTQANKLNFRHLNGKLTF